MDRRGTILVHLEQARRHVAEGEQHIASQRRIVAELEADGHDTAMACELLKQFEATQALHVADRDRLIAELVTVPD